MGEALEERVPAAALKNITILLNYSAFWREDPRWAKAQGGKEPGLGAPAQPLPPTPTYHYGSSRLGPQGLEHLPLHQEVGQEDDRRDLCDGGHGKGPLWGETRAVGPPSGPRAHGQRFPLDQLRVPGGLWASAAPQVRNATPPHTHTMAELQAQHRDAHDTVFSKSSQRKGLMVQGPRLPSCVQNENCRG